MSIESIRKGLESYLREHPEVLDGIVEGGADLVVDLFGPNRKVVNRILRLMDSVPLSQAKINQIEEKLQEDFIAARRKRKSGSPLGGAKEASARGDAKINQN